MKQQLTDFTKKAIQVIKKIPSGRVASYSQIAALAGKPNAARTISWILSSCSEKYDLPWHRVVNSQGKISFKINSKNFRDQKQTLLKEKVEFTSENQIDLAQSRWNKSIRTRAPKNLPSLFRS